MPRSIPTPSEIPHGPEDLSVPAYLTVQWENWAYGNSNSLLLQSNELTEPGLLYLSHKAGSLEETSSRSDRKLLLRLENDLSSQDLSDDFSLFLNRWQAKDVIVCNQKNALHAPNLVASLRRATFLESLEIVGSGVDRAVVSEKLFAPAQKGLCLSILHPTATAMLLGSILAAFSTVTQLTMADFVLLTGNDVLDKLEPCKNSLQYLNISAGSIRLDVVAPILKQHQELKSLRLPHVAWPHQDDADACSIMESLQNEIAAHPNLRTLRLGLLENHAWQTVPLLKACAEKRGIVLVILGNERSEETGPFARLRRKAPDDRFATLTIHEFSKPDYLERFVQQLPQVRDVVQLTLELDVDSGELMRTLHRCLNLGAVLPAALASWGIIIALGVVISDFALNRFESTVGACQIDSHTRLVRLVFRSEGSSMAGREHWQALAQVLRQCPLLEYLSTESPEVVFRGNTEESTHAFESTFCKELQRHPSLHTFQSNLGAFEATPYLRALGGVLEWNYVLRSIDIFGRALPSPLHLELLIPKARYLQNLYMPDIFFLQHALPHNLDPQNVLTPQHRAAQETFVALVQANTSICRISRKKIVCFTRLDVWLELFPKLREYLRRNQLLRQARRAAAWKPSVWPQALETLGNEVSPLFLALTNLVMHERPLSHHPRRVLPTRAGTQPVVPSVGNGAEHQVAHSA